jgi:hypothetical protein
VKGSALGTIASNDPATFGIVAQQLGAIKLGGAPVPLKAGVTDLFASRRPLAQTLGTSAGPATFDFNAFEVA